MLVIRRGAHSIRTVGVVGLGLMGHGIAQIAAQANYRVVAVETTPQALDIGIQRIRGSLEKLTARDIKKGTLTVEAAAAQNAKVLGNLTSSTSMTDVASCDLIVEAIAENMQLKLDFYTKLGALAKPESIFASNTSSLPITNMARISGRPKQFVGLHFFNPVQMMKLVEVIRTVDTDPEVYETVKSFGTALGKTVVSCGDTPGFIVNRLLVPYLAQAMSMVDKGDASIPDIDASMRLGAGHPMGPLELADYIGLDTCLHILEGWVAEFPNESAFFIPKVLKAKVNLGLFGRKSGKGFYRWDGDKCSHEVVAA